MHSGYMLLGAVIFPAMTIDRQCRRLSQEIFDRIVSFWLKLRAFFSFAQLRYGKDRFCPGCCQYGLTRSSIYCSRDTGTCTVSVWPTAALRSGNTQRIRFRSGSEGACHFQGWRNADYCLLSLLCAGRHSAGYGQLNTCSHDE